MKVLRLFFMVCLLAVFGFSGAQAADSLAGKGGVGIGGVVFQEKLGFEDSQFSRSIRDTLSADFTGYGGELFVCKPELGLRVAFMVASTKAEANFSGLKMKGDDIAYGGKLTKLVWQGKDFAVSLDGAYTKLPDAEAPVVFIDGQIEPDPSGVLGDLTGFRDRLRFIKAWTAEAALLVTKSWPNFEFQLGPGAKWSRAKVDLLLRDEILGTEETLPLMDAEEESPWGAVAGGRYDSGAFSVILRAFIGSNSTSSIYGTIGYRF